MIVVGIVAFVLGTAALITFSHHGGASSATRNAFFSAQHEIGGISSASGNGATLRYVPAAGGLNARLDLYHGRPNGGTVDAVPSRSIPVPGAVSAISGQNSVATSGFAVFVDGFGRATFGTWDGTTVITIPSCSTTGTNLKIVYDGGSVQMGCGSSFFDAYDAVGNKIS